MSCQPEGGCWCAELPKVLPIPESKSEGCLCRDCLTRKLGLQEISPAASPQQER
jgi:hypothetical protein